MSIFSDLYATARTFDASDNRTGVNRAIVHELDAMRDLLGDPTYDAVGLSASTSNEIQRVKQLAANPNSPATYTLSVVIDGVTYTTAALAPTANAAAVQSALDTALASLRGYTAGDAAVTGSALTAGILTITFSGDSVSGENIGQTVIALTVPNLATTSTTESVKGVASTTNEVQLVKRYANNPTGGTFTLTFNTVGKSPVTTAPIAYNAAHAVVQTAINTAMTASANKPSGWTNDDIAVTNGDLTSADLTLTYVGTSVQHADQGQVTIDGTALTTSTAYLADPAYDTTTAGTALRPAMATLKICGVIDSIPAGQGDSPSGVSAANGFKQGTSPNRLSEDTLRALCIQAEIEEERTGLADELFAIIGIS